MEEQEKSLFDTLTSTAQEPTEEKTQITEENIINVADVLDVETLAAAMVAGAQGVNKFGMSLMYRNKNIDVSKYEFRSPEELTKILAMWLKTLKITDPKQFIGIILGIAALENISGMWIEAGQDIKMLQKNTKTTTPEPKSENVTPLKNVINAD